MPRPCKPWAITAVVTMVGCAAAPPKGAPQAEPEGSATTAGSDATALPAAMGGASAEPARAPQTVREVLTEGGYEFTTESEMGMVSGHEDGAAVSQVKEFKVTIDGQEKAVRLLLVVMSDPSKTPTIRARFEEILKTSLAFDKDKRGAWPAVAEGDGFVLATYALEREPAARALLAKLDPLRVAVDGELEKPEGDRSKAEEIATPLEDNADSRRWLAEGAPTLNATTTARGTAVKIVFQASGAVIDLSPDPQQHGHLRARCERASSGCQNLVQTLVSRGGGPQLSWPKSP